jgi:hypothetical protein
VGLGKTTTIRVRQAVANFAAEPMLDGFERILPGEMQWHIRKVKAPAATVGIRSRRIVA